MKIKELYAPKTMPYQCVLEDLDGKFYSFSVEFRPITENDLSPLPGFRPIGNNGVKHADYVWKWYGLEREK